MTARFGRLCADCDAAADQPCGETCPSQATAPTSASIPRTERTERPQVRGDETVGVDTPAASAWLGEREGLSASEGAIVSLIVLGLSNQEVAGALHMSLHSTKTHIRSAYRKMGVTKRTQAISWGIHHGFRLTAPAARLNEGGKQ